MSPELEHSLAEKYPDLFKNKDKSPLESLMCFGCECGDGWHSILDNLFGFITALRRQRQYFLEAQPILPSDTSTQHLALKCPPVVLDQVKEKYGTLRVYWHFDLTDLEPLRLQVKDPAHFDRIVEKYTDLVDAAVDFAEYLSSKTCEITGRPGKLRTDGWYMTLCDEEAEKRHTPRPQTRASASSANAEPRPSSV